MSAKGDHINSMSPPPVGVEEDHNVKCHDLCVEGINVLEAVVLPNLINDLSEEFGNSLLNHL